MPQALQDTLVEGSEHCGREAGWHQGTLSQPQEMPHASSSAGERRFCPADARGRRYFLLLFLISCSYSSKSPAERAARRATPRTDRGSLRRLQGLMFGRVPAQKAAREESRLGRLAAEALRTGEFPPWPPAQAAIPHLPSPPAHSQRGAPGVSKEGGRRDASNPAELLASGGRLRRKSSDARDRSG